MLGIDARTARSAWTVFLVGLMIFAAYAVRRTLLIFTAALLFAYLLSPMVDLVDRQFQRPRSRNISLAIVYLILITFLITGGIVIGGAVADQASKLAASWPDLAKRLNEPSSWPLPPWLESRRAELSSVVQQQVQQHTDDVIPMVRRAGIGILSLLSDLPFLVLVPILSFFLLKDGGYLRQHVLTRYIDNTRRAVVENILGDIHLLLLQFMRAIVILCVLTFVFYLLFFLVIGVPYPVLLAAVAGLLEFLPFVGPLSAAVIIVIVAAFSGFPYIGWLIVFFLAYRMFQDYVVQPYLMSSGIELHPVLVIFGVMAGEQIAGIPGMFLSIPVLATLRVVFIRLWRHNETPLLT